MGGSVEDARAAGWRRLVSRDPARQILEVEFTYTVATAEGGEERLTYRAPIRYLFRFEAEHLLVRSGFTVEAIWTDYDRSPYGTKDPGELIFIATRA